MTYAERLAQMAEYARSERETALRTLTSRPSKGVRAACKSTITHADAMLVRLACNR